MKSEGFARQQSLSVRAREQLALRLHVPQVGTV